MSTERNTEYSKTGYAGQGEEIGNKNHDNEVKEE